MNFIVNMLGLLLVFANGLDILDRFELWAERHNINVADDIVYQRIYKKYLML